MLFHLPASGPSWTYALTQGLHVTIGLITVPVLLAKLWSVIPRLFAWPAVRSAAQLLERASLLLLVGGALFEFATGILNIQNYYPWHFGFVRAHYYGAWVFFAAFTLHVAVKLPVVVRTYRERGWLRPLRDDLAHTRPEPTEPDGLAPVAPATRDAQPPRAARTRRRRLADAAGAQRGRDGRRSAAPAGVARPARPRVRHRPKRFPGEPDGGGRRGDARR